MRGDFVSKINVEGSEISIIAIDDKDYISLTDIGKKYWKRFSFNREVAKK